MQIVDLYDVQNKLVLNDKDREKESGIIEWKIFVPGGDKMVLNILQGKNVLVFV